MERPHTNHVSAKRKGIPLFRIMAVPATVFYFTAYDRLIERFRRHGASWASPLLAGCTARTASATLVAPLELIRTKMQSERVSYRGSPSHLFHAPLSEMAHIMSVQLRGHGARSFFVGLGPTLLRDIPFSGPVSFLLIVLSGIYWSFYELLKARRHSDLGFLSSFLNGLVAGAAAAILTHPFDVLKTKQQVRIGEHFEGPVSALVVARQVLTDRGLRGMYTGENRASSDISGLLPRLSRVSFACAIMIGNYEYAKLYFARRNRQRSFSSS